MTSRKNTAKPLPTQERLRELLDYDPETGVFRWVNSCGNQINAGCEAGTKNQRGYIQIRLDQRRFQAHRLAFVWMTGGCPEIVDHIDRDCSNNSWSNLRPANKSQNNGNSKLRKTNTSGFRGVSWCKRERKWRAQIIDNGKKKNLGLYVDIQSASNAYELAAINKWGDYANV